MRLSTKLDILSTKLNIRYKVGIDNIKIKSDKNENAEPFIIEIEIIGKGRDSQLSVAEMNSINKKINLRDTAIIISRIDNKGSCIWTMATYFN